jgi:ribosomal protein L19E
VISFPCGFSLAFIHTRSSAFLHKTFFHLYQLSRVRPRKKGKESRKGEKEPAVQKKVDWQTNFQEERGTIKPFFNKSSPVKKILSIFLMLYK